MTAFSEQSTVPSKTVLLGDIGATNARFALLTDGVIGPVTWKQVAHHRNLGDALETFLKVQYRKIAVSDAILAVAGPVDGGRFYFTNSSWTIDDEELRDRFDFNSVRVLNDFEATALSLPHLTGKDLCALGGGHAAPGKPAAVLGPGSGLGVACLIADGPRPIAIASEGGHVTCAATSHREDAIVAYLRERFDHVSAERVLSGPGLENLYRAIAAVDGLDAPMRNAIDIAKAALQRTCPISCAALDMFCALLGGFAGNLALTYGARGGVYIAGGIAPRILDCLKNSAFRQRFEEKGRFRAYLESIPTNVIVHPETTFLGLKALAERAV